MLGRVGRDGHCAQPPSRSLRLLQVHTSGWPGVADTGAEEREQLVSSSRTQRKKKSLFREICDQARALQATAEQPPDLGPGAGEATTPGGPRRWRVSWELRAAVEGIGWESLQPQSFARGLKELGWGVWIIAPLGVIFKQYRDKVVEACRCR